MSGALLEVAVGSCPFKISRCRASGEIGSLSTSCSIGFALALVGCVTLIVSSALTYCVAAV